MSIVINKQAGLFFFLLLEEPHRKLCRITLRDGTHTHSLEGHDTAGENSNLLLDPYENIALSCLITKNIL